MFWISDTDGQLDEKIDHFKAPKKELIKKRINKDSN